jgi:hypothetical protein
MSITNNDMEFKCLATKCDYLLESNQKNSIEKGDLEAIVSRFRIVNEQDSKIIQEIEQ